MHNFRRYPFPTEKIETKHRRIITDIPSPDTIDILKKNILYEPNSMNYQLPIVWDKAEDYQIFDKSGNCWIDFTSCIFVSNVGHAHPKVCQAIIDIIKKPLIASYYYPTAERTELAELLVKITPPYLDKALLFSTGSESTEVALKMMMLYGRNFNNRKKFIISFDNSFHGKTMGAQLMGGKDEEKEWIAYKPRNIIHLPFPYPWKLNNWEMNGKDFFKKTLETLLYRKKLQFQDIAGFIIEPYQGWCAIFPPLDYMQALKEWCKNNRVLLTVDEVQSGFGRTGKLFAYEHLGIMPDIICCGKGITSSIPLSAVITNNNIANSDKSFHSTHGGNPVAVASALASIKVLLEERLVDTSYRKGLILESLLKGWQEEQPKYIKAVYCKGLLASVFIKSPDKNDIEFVDKLIEIAMRKGLMSVRTGSGTLKIGPPLTIPDDALVEGIHVLKESLNELNKNDKKF